jgi:alkylhydroperoxidase/carboxymuconolactone decarboxylase family protein YurZ
MTETTDRLSELRELFIAKRGYWNDNWQFILERDPDFFEGYLHLSSYAWENGTLDPKLREFLYIVTVASVTHIFPPGLHQHMRNAIELGATEAELLTVLQIASTVGIQTYLLGVESIEAARPGSTRGIRNGSDPEAVLARHRELLGSAGADVRAATAADPAFYDRWLDLASVPFTKSDVIAPKDAHLIAFTAYCEVTHLCAPGARQHAEAALEAGATPAELIEALEIVSGMSIHSVTIGLPILFEELNREEPS